LKRFISKWRGGKQARPEPVRPSLPAMQRVYCIGDIHGRLDLLMELHRMIAEDAECYAGSSSVVYLGDFVDRGEQSKEVIDLLLASPLAGFKTVFLMGNHEQTLLDFLLHPRDVASWLTFGGRATLQSYGVGVFREFRSGDIDGLRDEFEVKLPRSHLEFYRNCLMTYVAGAYCFVHAGIRPGVALGDQHAQDLLWIRGDFIDSGATHEHIVVHGHSITAEVEWLPNRIGIDTGAFQSGVLTCLVLEGEEQRLLQTG
jgi:serine/threonine protein phosphatase 1